MGRVKKVKKKRASGPSGPSGGNPRCRGDVYTGERCTLHRNEKGKPATVPSKGCKYCKEFRCRAHCNFSSLFSLLHMASRKGQVKKLFPLSSP